MTIIDLKKIVYRGYQDGDEQYSVSLFNLVFKNKYNISQWHWTHKENPIKQIYISLAFYNSKLVGQSVGIPLLLTYGGETINAVRVQNVMVHPDFRKKGIFFETLRRLTDYIYTKQVDFIFAFPNDYSVNAFIKKLDYQDLSGVSIFNLPAKSIMKAPSHNLTFNIQEDISFKQADVDFINSQLKQFAIFNPRSLDYLTWRYHKNSGKRYSIVRVFDETEQVGFAICKLYSEAMSIDLVEFIFKCDRNLIHSALNAIYSYYGKSSIESFNVWSMEHYPVYQYLLKIGFNKTDSVTHIVYKTLSPKCSRCCDKITSYYLSMGDSDVY